MVTKLMKSPYYDILAKKKVKVLHCEALTAGVGSVSDSMEYHKIIAVANESAAFTTPSGEVIVFDAYDAKYAIHHRLKLYEPHYVTSKMRGCVEQRFKCDMPQIVALNTFLFGTIGWKSMRGKSKMAKIVFADGGNDPIVKNLPIKSKLAQIIPHKLTGDMSKFILANNTVSGCIGNIDPYLMYIDWGKWNVCLK